MISAKPTRHLSYKAEMTATLSSQSFHFNIENGSILKVQRILYFRKTEIDEIIMKN